MSLPVIIWFGIGTALIVSEFFVPGIVLVFFGVAAWVVAALSVFVTNPGVQVAIWIALSLALLFSLRNWLKQHFVGFTAQRSDLASMPNDVKGARVEVVEALEPGAVSGRVRWKGTEWRAEADEAIPVGATVEIVEQQNLVLKVKKIS